MNICLEIIRLALQFFGALAVTYLGVKWALNRYKREKMWEKHVNVYGDIISSYRKLLAILGRWRPHLSGTDLINDDEIDKLVAKYHAERDRLFDALSVGLVILPKEQAKKLDEVLGQLSRPVQEERDHLKALEAEIDAVSEALKYIIPIARRVAGSRGSK